MILESDAIERDYHSYFDLTLVAEDLDKTFEQSVSFFSLSRDRSLRNISLV